MDKRLLNYSCFLAKEVILTKLQDPRIIKNFYTYSDNIGNIFFEVSFPISIKPQLTYSENEHKLKLTYISDNHSNFKNLKIEVLTCCNKTIDLSCLVNMDRLNLLEHWFEIVSIIISYQKGIKESQQAEAIKFIEEYLLAE